jgi:hypothetical protein
MSDYVVNGVGHGLIVDLIFQQPFTKTWSPTGEQGFVVEDWRGSGCSHWSSIFDLQAYQPSQQYLKRGKAIKLRHGKKEGSPVSLTN